MISQLCFLVTYFHKSTQAYDTLEECVRLPKGITRGIEGIGKTHFATICAAAISVQHCLPTLRELVNIGIIKFPGKAHDFHNPSIISSFSGSHCGLNFELGLACFIDIQGQIAKAIVCLESTQTNVADVYKYWLAICGCIKQLFEDSSSGFNVEEMGQIYAIINSCFREQLKDGPADCYLAALCLDPRMFTHSSPLMSACS
ncbi:hypothetical protein BDR07DRAFT_1297462 [Suillus spraguei]|nr:hypothetical protein BDR07DRAFT_1297462 [Suillus spraguei]